MTSDNRAILRPFDRREAVSIKHAQIAARFQCPTLETAVEMKIEDQAEFVRRWRETVRRPGQPEKNLPRSAQILSFDTAEFMTGIKHQQVSRWARSLKDREAYRAKRFGKAFRSKPHNRALTGATALTRLTWFQ